MESIYEIMLRWYGRKYLPSYGGYQTPRTRSKHQATKRGYQHKHGLSVGQRRAATYLAKHQP